MSSARSCEICHLTPAVAYCDCSQPFAHFCQGCTTTHFNLPRPHKYHPLSVSPRVVAQKNGLNDDCILCHNADAEVICCCQRAFLTTLCNACVPRHREKNRGVCHVLIPHSSKVFINKPDYLPNLLARRQRLVERKTEISSSITLIATCMEELRKKCDLLLERIASYCAENITILSEAKEYLELKLRKALEEVEDNVHDPDYEPKEGMAQLLLAVDNQLIEEPLFSYQLLFSAEAVDSALRLDYRLKTFSEDDVSKIESVLLVPWLSSTSLKLYNTETQSWEAPISFAKTFVDQNSSVAMLPNKQLLASGSTKARRKVLKIDIEKETARLVNPFSEKRFGHGFIYWRNFVYAFGGYQLRSCERLACQKEEAAWELLPDMNFPHYFSTPSAFDSFIYLCGGDGTNVVEMFDTAASRFSVIRCFTLPEKTNTFSAVDTDRLIIFQKDVVITWQLGSSSLPTTTSRKLVDQKYTYSNVSGLSAKRCVFPALYYKKLLVCIDLASMTSVKITL